MAKALLTRLETLLPSQARPSTSHDPRDIATLLVTALLLPPALTAAALALATAALLLALALALVATTTAALSFAAAFALSALFSAAALSFVAAVVLSAFLAAAGLSVTAAAAAASFALDAGTHLGHRVWCTLGAPAKGFHSRHDSDSPKAISTTAVSQTDPRSAKHGAD